MGKPKKNDPKVELITDNRERVIQELQSLPWTINGINLLVLVSGLTAPPTTLEHSLKALEELAAKANNNNKTSKTLIYRSVVNFDDKSKDGILVCGKRLADEINQLVQLVPPLEAGKRTVRLSLSGTSFGGLVARAALAYIIWKHNSNHVAVLPQLFSTVMTPHLGSRDAMHSPLPQPVLGLVSRYMAVVMGQTGKDLMRYKSDAIDRLVNEPQYMEPLAKFRKREAYTNSYRTDFRVATGTAVFVAPDSESPHQTLPGFVEGFPYCIHALETPQGGEWKPRQEQPLDATSKKKSQNSWMKEQCEKLDALGWTKVFCDMREELPCYRVPVLSAKTKKIKTPEPDCESSWTSAELCQKYCRNDPATKGTWYLPQAHSSLMVNTVTQPEDHYMWAGMPFVKEYAARMMKDVLQET